MDAHPVQISTELRLEARPVRIREWLTGRAQHLVHDRGRA
jgi:hypothetical protein